MKKKIVVISTIILTLHISLMAQDPLMNKHFIEVFVGQSYLSGNLIKNDYSDPNSGFAISPAINFGIDGAYYLNKYIGIGGLISFWEFGAHSDKLAQGIQESYGTMFGSANVDIYKTYNFFVGPYISYPVAKWLTFDYRLLGGLTNATLPQINLQLLDQHDDGSPATYNIYQQNKSIANAFGFQTGLGARVNVYEGISLTLKGDYYYSNPNFTVTNTPSSVLDQSPTLRQPITNYHQPIKGFIVSVGLAYQFGK